MVTSRNKDSSSITSLTTFGAATDWNFATRNKVWVSQRVKLFFLFYFSVTVKRATPFINYGEIGKKALGAKISGTVFGWTSVNYDRSMAIQRRPLTNNCLHWLRPRSRIYCPKACVMSSPIAISKLKYFGFGFRTSNWSTLNSKIKSAEGKIVDNVKLKYFRIVYTFSASVSSLFVPPSTVLAIASLIFLYSSP